ncbi:MAG: DUF4258 domain-containing protein [Candidatus Margulisbacteria bacterium]|nr:DUF4258 domain-containing protein [Candidatus Margulisiibacteriota bacterium]
MRKKLKIDIHAHLKARMLQRGISIAEIELTLAKGCRALDAKEGTAGKTLVFPYEKEWEGKHYNKKEVTVYFKYTRKELIILTVKARYGNDFKVMR